ncbi:MAG TPA: tetratricopeptide repeat protein [Candidatus Omnitrophota bacterium]|nr:tetratricopeptide repeat protein [Candidatus Omnitrophota bacterium]HPB68678.1 tetratricopeptide repeat protein [Candidatus Omnitrophota bacterium]HQO58077.1 tetratricopeptide repeat protein [Candidatus Omnitrophota bacterium]
MQNKPASTKIKSGWLYAGIFLLAFCLRLGYQQFLKANYLFYGSPSSDVTYYQDWAREIASGNWRGDQTFFGLPLYPYFLAVLIRLALGHIEIVRFFHLVLGSFNCVLLFAVGGKIFSRRVGFLAAILAATNFFLIYYDWLMMPVTLLISLSLFLLYYLANDLLKDRPREWFLFGIISGITLLGDGKFAFFLCLLTLSIVARWPYFWRVKFFKILLPLGLGAALILASSALRNRIVGGDWTVISAQSGLSFYTGNNPLATGVYDHPAFLRPSHQGQDEDQKIIAEKIARRKLSPRQISQFWQDKAFQFIREHPSQSLKLFLRKNRLFFTDTENAHDADLLLQENWQRILDINPFGIICPLALIGFFLTRKKYPATLFLNLLIISQWLMTTVFFLTTRHRATVLPVFLLYESYTVFWAADCSKKKEWSHLGITAFFILLFILAFPKELADRSYTDFIRFSKTGMIYLQRSDPFQAQVAFQNALNIRPNDSTTLYNLGNTCLQTRNYSMAQDYFEKSLRLCSYNVDALFNLAYTFEQTGQTKRAVDLYQQVLQYQPGSADVLFRLTQTHQQAGECEQALDYFRQLVEQNPALSEDLKPYLKECLNP